MQSTHERRRASVSGAPKKISSRSFFVSVRFHLKRERKRKRNKTKKRSISMRGILFAVVATSSLLVTVLASGGEGEVVGGRGTEQEQEQEEQEEVNGRLLREAVK